MQDFLMDSEFKKVLEQAEQESRQELQSTAAEVSLGMSPSCLKDYEQQMQQAGLDLVSLQDAEARDLAEAQKFIESVRPGLILAGGEAKVAKMTSDEEVASSLETALLPDGYAALTPIGVTEISSDSLTQVWLGSGSCQNYYVKAWGGGWGCTGGVGSIERHLTWYFRYTPPTNKFYAIKPYVNFNGFYITKANDKWYNCKYARSRVQMKVNAYQYNWKGEQVWTVLDSSDDNINVNRRFDTTRTVNYTALLARGDSVLIQVRVGLYAYAKGSGSYSELNFSTGAANKICIPNVYVG
jgi:hypothetical protein